MADLSVQPKKRSSFLPWLLLLLGIAAGIWALVRHKNNDIATGGTTAATARGGDWNGIDFAAPALSYDEISDKGINVRGNNAYGIYGLGENVLFDEGKATIRPDAEANLKQVIGSIDKRYSGGEVRVYGYTDATGSTDTNKQLAEQRAEAVKSWMQSNGIGADRISVNAVGEARPVATNSTEEGRQQNRRVEIVARSNTK